MKPSCSPNHTTFEVQSYTTSQGLSFMERIEPWNYRQSSSEVWKKICSIFFYVSREIWSSKHSTSLFSPFKSTYRKPVLNPPAQTKFPFISHLFSFLPERQRRVGLLCTTNPNWTFLQCIRLWSTSTKMTAYLNFHKNNNFPFWFKYSVYLM